LKWDPIFSTIELSTLQNSSGQDINLINVLIIARPGMLRESLSALLATLPEINVVSATNDLASSYEFVSRHQPMICIIDFSNQRDDKENKFDQLKSIRLEMKTIILVDTVEAKHVAEAHGIDKVVIKGSSVQQLTKTISDCIEETVADMEKKAEK
jgi:DNA-binding NarL/FixJ family response regulator